MGERCGGCSFGGSAYASTKNDRCPLQSPHHNSIGFIFTNVPKIFVAMSIKRIYLCLFECSL